MNTVEVESIRLGALRVRRGRAHDLRFSVEIPSDRRRVHTAARVLPFLIIVDVFDDCTHLDAEYATANLRRALRVDGHDSVGQIAGRL